MAADVARKTRVVAFGIALCFLAVLFFVEAKTTWAAFGGECSSGFCAAGIHSVNPSQKTEADSELGRLSDRGWLVLSAVVTLFAAIVVAEPQRRMRYIPERVLFDAYGGVGHERFVRPPPSR